MKIKALTIGAMLVVAAIALAGCSSSSPSPTTAPTQTAAATATAAASETPAVTEVPVVTQSPVMTEVPVMTQVPVKTQVPVTTVVPATTAAAAPAQLELTVEELAAYNGKDGKPAYVAVNGVIYDVTNVPAWQNGMHKGNVAGNDLTEAIKKSPHGESVLKNLPVVGKLK
jgi:predicted heme/steroid binding protein